MTRKPIRAGVLALLLLFPSATFYAQTEPSAPVKKAKVAVPHKMASVIAGELKVKPYKIARLSLDATEVPEGSVVVWDVSPEEAVDIEDLPDMLRFDFTGPPGTYYIKSRVFDFSAKPYKVKTLRTVVVIEGSVPPPPVPPGPGPTPPPPVPPGPAPIPADGLHVMIVYETDKMKNLPLSQYNVLYNKTIRQYLDDKCVKDASGPARRMYDQNEDLRNEPQWAQDAFKRTRTTIPWLIVSNPRKGGGYEGPLPLTVDETMKILKQYGD